MTVKKPNNKGYIYIFSGNGKGKTSAALGVAMRSVLIGGKVFWISWFKDERWDISEKKLPKLIGKGLEMYWMGKGFYIKKEQQPNKLEYGVQDYDTPAGHKRAAAEALSFASNLMIKNDPPGGNPLTLLVLDEILNAVNEKLISWNDVKNILSKRGAVNIVLTGRGVTKEMTEYADLVTEMKKIKHPFDIGKLAVRGLDY